jgi:hypothetical protein
LILKNGIEQFVPGIALCLGYFMTEIYLMVLLYTDMVLCTILHIQLLRSLLPVRENIRLEVEQR